MSNITSKPIELLYKPEANVLGIDLGTTNIVCALQKIGDSKFEVIAYYDGRRIMPSIVEFNELEVCVGSGTQAHRRLKTNTGYVLYGKHPLYLVL